MSAASPLQPRPFLDALAQRRKAGQGLADLAHWAQGQAVAAHVLSVEGHDPANLAGLHAAGARAIAATLAIGAAPLVLMAEHDGLPDAGGFGDQLLAALQSYDRIHALVLAGGSEAVAGILSPDGLEITPQGTEGPLFWAILILPPEAPSAYWSKKG